MAENKPLSATILYFRFLLQNGISTVMYYMLYATLNELMTPQINIMRQFILCLFTILFVQCAGAQKSTSSQGSYITKKTATGKAKKAYDKGMSYNISGNDKKALEEFNKALKAAPNFIDAQIQWSSLKHYLKDYAAAEKGFEKVLAIDPTYSPKVIYVLGIAELNQGKGLEGIEHLKQYIASKPKNKILLAKAERRIKDETFSAEAKANPVPFAPKSLGNLVNTTDQEYLPSLTADESILVFTKRIRGQEDFYLSKKVDDVWQKGIPLTDVNTPNNEGAQNITPDGRFMTFVKCDDRKTGYGSCDIYFSEVINGRWTAAKNIGSPINSRARETQPSLTADGQTLYFTSERSGRNGTSDIYLSQRDTEGKWSKPKLLSDKINTEGDDQSPFIHPDGQTLYFMSNGHPGMGGFDLFYSRKQPDGTWGDPINLGYPINTEADESTLVVSLDGKTAYYASDRILSENNTTQKEKRATGMDLYSFELYEEARPQPVTYVRGNITDAETAQPLVSRVEIVDMSTGKIHAAINSDEDGFFLITLPVGKNYAFNVSKPAYVFHSEHFALKGLKETNDPYELAIGLRAVPEEVTGSTEIPASALEKYKPTILRNVFFDTGSAALKSESFIELDRLKTFLNDNSGIRIQLNGHTDNVGSDTNNLTLSDNRAKSVFTYLVENGIDAARMTYKGYGETSPIETNDTEAGRQANRRTEFMIIGN